MRCPMTDSAWREEVERETMKEYMATTHLSPRDRILWHRTRLVDSRLEVRQLRDALIWMSGSADFAPGGQAHEGWLKIRHLVQK